MVYISRNGVVKSIIFCVLIVFSLWLAYSHIVCFVIFVMFYGSQLQDQSWRSYVTVRSVILSVILCVSWITHERGNGRRPNMVGMGKG